MSIEREQYEKGWAVCAECLTRRPEDMLALNSGGLRTCLDRDWCFVMETARWAAETMLGSAGNGPSCGPDAGPMVADGPVEFVAHKRSQAGSSGGVSRTHPKRRRTDR